MSAGARVGDPLRVLVCGQGYVGLPLAVHAALAGHSVVGYDIDAARIKRLAAAESYVEDLSSALLRRVDAKRARTCLGWTPSVFTPRLVTLMVDVDVQQLDDQLSGRAVRVDAVI